MLLGLSASQLLVNLPQRLSFHDDPLVEEILNRLNVSEDVYHSWSGAKILLTHLKSCHTSFSFITVSCFSSNFFIS